MRKIVTADAEDGLKTLPAGITDTCVTSPPYYGLRDYGIDGQIGREESPDVYIERLVAVFRDVRRVLRDDGTLWVVIGDSYAGSNKGVGTSKAKEVYIPDRDSPQCNMRKTWSGIKAKNLIGIPWALAFALRGDGWFLRQDIIWHKKNGIPESVTDRCTKCHEYIFLLSKSARYYYDAEAIAEPVAESTMKWLSRRPGKTNGPVKAMPPRYGGNKYTADKDVFYRTKSWGMYEYKPRRNKRDVWTVAVKPFYGAHSATFPSSLIRPCILAGSREGGIVLDPFLGSGTTAVVAIEENRGYIGIDLNPDYVEIAKRRIACITPKLRNLNYIVDNNRFANK